MKLIERIKEEASILIFKLLVFAKLRWFRFKVPNYKAIARSLASSPPALATGDTLERLALQYGIERIPGESDDELRKRTTAFITCGAYETPEAEWKVIPGPGGWSVGWFECGRCGARSATDDCRCAACGAKMKKIKW